MKTISLTMIRFNDDAVIHFAAKQDNQGYDREMAISEKDGIFYFTIADQVGHDSVERDEIECPTLQHAYAQLIKDLNVPL